MHKRRLLTLPLKALSIIRCYRRRDTEEAPAWAMFLFLKSIHFHLRVLCKRDLHIFLLKDKATEKLKKSSNFLTVS